MNNQNNENIEKNKQSFMLMLSLFIIVFITFQTFAQKKKVACMGDSITYGYGFSDTSTQSYPSQMQVLLGTTNWQVSNYGENSRTMLKGGGYSFWDSWAYTAALNYNPDVVVIGLGTNDSKNWLWDSKSSEFKGDYKAMVESFQNLSTKPDIWMFLIIPGEKADWGIYNSYIDQVNVKIKEVALEKGLGLIDLHTAFQGHTEWYNPADNIHPTVAGAGVIAQKVQEMLVMAKPEITISGDKVVAPNGYDYQWYIDGLAVVAADGGNLKEMTPTVAGTYKVSVKINSGNNSRIVSKDLVLTGSLSVIETPKKSRLKVYPNPVLNVIYVDACDYKNYKIIDLSGKSILSGKLLNESTQIDIHSLSSGTYILSIGNESIKIVKK